MVKVALRFNTIQFARPDQALQQRPSLASVIRPEEQIVFSAQADYLQGVFGQVVIRFSASSVRADKHIMDLAAGVGPAGGFLYMTFTVELIEPGVSIRLQHTAEPGQMRLRVDSVTCGCPGENDPRLLREPDTKSLGDGLFEIRTMGTDIARGLWVYQAGERIFLLRIFIKTSQKTSPVRSSLRFADWRK